MTSWLRQTCIYVSDIDATIRFYETLGLEATSRTVISDDLIEAIIENPEKGAWLQLAQSRTVTPPIDMGSALWKLYVYTDDCQGVHDRAVAAGYRSMAAPLSPAQWPVTLAFVQDPDGYVIQLLQRNETPTGRNAGGSPRDQTL
jgi:lactoylglutathione lyase